MNFLKSSQFTVYPKIGAYLKNIKQNNLYLLRGRPTLGPRNVLIEPSPL